MSDQIVPPDNVENIVENEIPADSVVEILSENLKNRIKEKSEAAILCKAKNNNPNYLSIIYANEKFYEIFGISEANLIGKSYDFLFNDLDFDYSSEDQIEYIRLIKAVKDFHQSSVIVSLSDHKEDAKKIKLKIGERKLTQIFFP